MGSWFGGGKPEVTYQSSTVSNDPWAPQQSHLRTLFSRAETDVLNKPREFYPGSTVVDFSDQTNQALQMQEQRALAGSPVTDAAQNQVQQTLQGDYLGASNPYMQDAIGAATRPMMDSFKEDIMPSIQSGFAGAGRYGSGMQARAQERAGEMALRQVGDVASGMAYKNYADERGRQLQAGTLAPTMAAQDYTDISKLAQVGGTREAQAGSQLQEDIARFNHNQNAPMDALSNYAALIKGGYGSQSTQNQPIYRNPMAEGLSAGLAATSIVGNLFGQGGIWPQ